MSYYDKVEGKKFNELKNDVDFQKDLINFFTSERYGYSKEDVMKLGPDGLINDFVEHMRWQSTNEATIAKDLWFKQSAEKAGDTEALDSFGRLMMAWDRSEGGGTGFIAGAGDYIRAVAQSPSTAASVASAGFGAPVAKFLARASVKAGSAALRKSLMSRLTVEAAKGIIKDKASVAVAQQGLKGAALKGALTAGAVEGTIGGAQAYGEESIREQTVEGYEKDMGNVIASAAASAALSGSLGGFYRYRKVNAQNKSLDTLADIALKEKKSEVAALKEAQSKLTSAAKVTKGKPESKEYSVLKGRITSLINLTKMKEEGKARDFLKPLDPTRVAEGEEVAARVFDGPNDEFVTTQFTAGTFKKVAAATIDIADELNFKLDDNVRITEKVANILSSGTLEERSAVGASLTKIREKYRLSKEEMSLVFLSDMSEAGKTLNVGSQISKVISKSAQADIAKKVDGEFKSFLERINVFASEGIVNPADQALEDLVTDVAKGATEKTSTKIGRGIQGTAREIDRYRIGSMTTQLATTAANAGFSLFRVSMDMSDRFFYNMLSGRNPMSGVLDLARGLSWGKNEAELTRLVGYLDSDSELYRIFHDISRIEDDLDSNTVLGKTVRAMNFLNAAVDGQFKQAVFYSSLQRQLRDDPRYANTLLEHLKDPKTKGFSDLPEEFIKKAEKDALSFSFQRGYEDSTNFFGKLAFSTLKAHKKLPFVISSFVPFPRFTANMIQLQYDYLPTGLASGIWNRLAANTAEDVALSNAQIAKGATGLTLLAGAVYARLNAPEGSNYMEWIDPETNEVQDFTKILGPIAPHMFFGDMIARHIKGEPINLTLSEGANEFVDIVTGLELFGYGDSFLEVLADSYESGEVKEPLAKVVADVAATFTMPLANLRDIQGQINVDSAATPYTRELEPESPSALKTQMFQRATRFLPDYDFLQLSQSFNGKKDVPLYDPFDGDKPVRKYNPILGQITGVTFKPKKTELRQEMDRLGIKGYVVYGSRKIKNPNTDVALREILAGNLSKEAKAFMANEVFSSVGLEGGSITKRYDELPSEVQKKELEKFLRNRINYYEDIVEKSFKSYAEKSPRSALGWIYNNYKIQSNKYRDAGTIDRIVVAGTGGEFMTEKEYFDGVESPVEMANRMTAVLTWAEEYEQTQKGFEHK